MDSISIVRNFNRDEYAALAKPHDAKRKRTLIVSVGVCVLLMLVPTIFFAGLLAISSASGPASGSITGLIFAEYFPVYLVIQILDLVMGSVRLWSIFYRDAAKAKILFPDRYRTETITTRIAPYGLVQSSAGVSIITPWGNVVRIEELPEAFVLHTRNLNDGIWYTSANMVYFPKTAERNLASEISIELLTRFRDSAETSPNYIWQANEIPYGNPPAVAATVWPPPPDIPVPKSEIDIPIAGTIHLPTLQAKFDNDQLSFKYGPVARMQSVQNTLVFPVIIFMNAFRGVASIELYTGLAVALVVSILIFVAAWFKKPVIVVNAQKSLYLSGTRFARTSELQTITVTDAPAIFIAPSRRKPAYITIRRTNGKSRRLVMQPIPSAYETNLAAMILGQYLSQSDANSREGLQ
jgi:hypothetical protein